MKSRRDLRLASGLVLFTYLTLHLACHALGLVSLDAAEAALRATVVVCHSGLGTVLLYAAAAAHVGLALLAVYERRSLRMPPVQALRILLGMTMPVILIGHFVGTRYAFERFGLPAEYQRVVASLWATHGQGRQLALLAPGWLHGCLGLNFAFGARRGWQSLRFGLFGAALLLPVLAGLGFLAMARELAAHPAVIDAYRASANLAQGTALAQTHDLALAAYLGLIGLVVAARALRSLDERRRNSVVRITYPGRSVSVPRGWTVLEASRSFGIAHPSMCGGRARCTTCRVQVTGGQAHCPPPGIDERRTLDRIDAGAGVRLACQLRPTGDIAVEPLLAVDEAWWRAAAPARPTTEREVALLCFDIRPKRARSTEAASAHDTIYVLDRFHAIADAAIQSAGGVPCGQTGDATIALFGLESGVREACMQALIAARAIEEGGAALAGRLARELGFEADFSIGVHLGPVVAGMIGEPGTRRLSVVGDAIRAAERLQAFAALHGARFVVSKAAADGAGIADAAFGWRAVGDDAGDDAILLLCADASARDLVLALHSPG